MGRSKGQDHQEKGVVEGVVIQLELFWDKVGRILFEHLLLFSCLYPISQYDEASDDDSDDIRVMSIEILAAALTT